MVAGIKAKMKSGAGCTVCNEHNYFPVICTRTAIFFQWIFYLNSCAGHQLTHSMPLEL